MNDAPRHAPLHARPQLPTILAVGALVLAAIASAAGLLVDGLYRDTEAWIREAQATDLVTLAVAVPVLAAGLWLARQGDPRWRLVAIGALWYLAYSYAIFAFSVAPNPLALAYIAVLGLSAWALVLGIGRTDPATGQTAGLTDRSPRLPARPTGAFLVIVPILFGLLWMGEIAAAVSAEGPSEALAEAGLPTNPIWPLDLAFALPVVLYAGIRLLRGEARAVATALPALAFLVLIGLAVLGVFVFDVAAGGALEPLPFLIVGTITVVAVVLTALALLPAQPTDAPRTPERP